MYDVELVVAAPESVDHEVARASRRFLPTSASLGAESGAVALCAVLVATSHRWGPRDKLRRGVSVVSVFVTAPTSSLLDTPFEVDSVVGERVTLLGSILRTLNGEVLGQP